MGSSEVGERGGDGQQDEFVELSLDFDGSTVRRLKVEDGVWDEAAFLSEVDASERRSLSLTSTLFGSCQSALQQCCDKLGRCGQSGNANQINPAEYNMNVVNGLNSNSEVKDKLCKCTKDIGACCMDLAFEAKTTLQWSNYCEASGMYDVKRICG